MKQCILILLFLFLSACSTLNAFKPRTYDPMEYSKTVEIVVDSTRAIHLCNHPEPANVNLWKHIEDVNTHSLELDEFERNKDLNALRIGEAVSDVRSMVINLQTRMNFSAAYCVHKLSNIQASARIIARTVGKSDRYAMCDGQIKERLDLFTASFNEKKLSVSEYKELVFDIYRLEKVDTVGCTESVKAKVEKDLDAVEKALLTAISL
jgi:hypothetical protein